MSTLSNLINLILLRTGTVDDVLRQFDKYQAKLQALSTRLRDLAAKEEAAAQLKLDAAKKNLAEAERAATVAGRFNDLTK